jgi:ketosteroid isomerase-like protein
VAGSDIDVAKQAYEAFGRGDVPATLAVFEDNLEWYEAPSVAWGGRHEGHRGFIEGVVAPLTAAVDDFTVTPERFFTDGEGGVTVLVRYSGKGRDTGRPLDMQGIQMLEIRDGKIVRYESFLDTVKFNEVVSEPAQD